MALTPRLDLRQTQSLVMTPQLQQAIKLLQLSNIELTAFVEQELERNPLLEREDADEREPADEVVLDNRSAGDEAVLERTAPGQDEAPLDVDVDNVWQEGPGGSGQSLTDWGSRGGRADFSDDESSIEQTLSRGITLREHLMEQVAVDIPDAGDRLIAAQMVEMIDESGYLIGGLDEIAELLGCGVARVESVLERLQRFDPAGIFARSLSECLALQLRERNRLDPAIQALLDNLEMLARRDLAGLIRVCGVDSEDLAEMIAEIRALNPKPALLFDDDVAQAVTPDVLMRPGPGGGWLIELNNDTLPRVLVNARYYSQVAGAVRTKDDRNYLSEQFQSANWLVKSLHQRATTILKVATEIVRQQDAFFHKGIQFLRPLVLRDIAQAIGMHESTVSRVTANKYMATPRGIFELKYFFTQAIAGSAGGESHSAESVRHRIKALIDAEGAEVLSDDRIVDILKSEGVDIARRTVAKYREAMHIPSSVQRRREKALGA